MVTSCRENQYCEPHASVELEEDDTLLDRIRLGYDGRMPNVRILNEAASEIAALPGSERTALENAITKLNEFGEALGYPHTSQVKGTALRELRPRRGRSPWRALYQRIGGDVFVIAAVGAEALHDPRGFRRAIMAAQQRLDSLEAPS